MLMLYTGSIQAVDRHYFSIKQLTKRAALHFSAVITENAS